MEQAMDLKAFLQEEVKPALGCTEPGAVALASAAAAAALGAPVERAVFRVSANVLKNGAQVGIPGGQGLRGNVLAGALGAMAGDASRGLEVLAGIGEDDVLRARALVQSGAAKQELVQDVPSVYVEAELEGGGHRALAIISGRHDDILEVRLDGKVLEERQGRHQGLRKRPAYKQELLSQDMDGLWELAGRVDEEMEARLLEGAAMNLRMAREGLERCWGLGSGYALAKRAPEGDLLWRVKMFAAAAADVRMEGGPWPVMSSAGSGNHGIVAILPAVVVAESWGKSDRQLAEALLLSHLLTGYLKAHIGVLTPICGCAVAAGVGAAGAIVRLGGGTADMAQRAAGFLLGSLMGMICDGAKGSCALKVSAAAGEAYTAALMALDGFGGESGQHFIPLNLVEMGSVVAAVSKMGFAHLDGAILKVLAEREAARTTEEARVSGEKA